MSKTVGIVAAALLVIATVGLTVQAGIFEERVITPATSTVGDKRLFTVEETERDLNGSETRRSNMTVFLESVEAVADRFGSTAMAAAYRIDQVDDEEGSELFAFRCYMEVGSNRSVKRELLTGMLAEGLTSSSGFDTGLSHVEVASNTTVEAFFDAGGCEAVDVRGGEALVEGGSIIFPWGWNDARGDVLSAPAEAAEFHGRPALTYAWDLRDLQAPREDAYEGRVQVTLVDGIPGVARLVVDVTYDDKDTGRGEGTYLVELAAFEQGNGERLPPIVLREHSTENPTMRPVPYSEGIDDVALGFRYPFADAMTEALADEGNGLAAFFDAHPDALLATADHSTDAWSSNTGEGTDETWSFVFSDTEQSFRLSMRKTVESSDPARTSVPLPLGVPRQSIGPFQVGGDVGEEGESWWRTPPTRAPNALLDSATLAQISESHDMPIATLTGVSWSLGSTDGGEPRVEFILTDFQVTADGGGKGRDIRGDAIAGTVHTIYRHVSERSESGILDPAPKPLSMPSTGQVSALSALARPGSGAGLAVASAAAGGILLLFALKFLLLPLFTRLRRASLLDNPVRARVYERVRAEAGIHRAEIVDFLGIGEGATDHHLKQLVAHRYLVRFEEGGFVRYYAAGEVPPDVARRFAVLRAGSHQAVYDLYLREPSLSLREAGARLGISAPAVHNARRKLKDAGLLPATAPPTPGLHVAA